MKFFPIFMLLAAALAVTACSTTSDDKADYAGARVMGPLQVPPDLNQPIDNEASDGATSYLELQKTQGADAEGKVLQDLQGMRFVREGSQFWLDVDDTPTHVWQSLKLFFRRLGFKIVFEKPALGIMQTDYQENRANIPANWFLRMFHKLGNSGMMDSFRAHIEYDSDKKITRVFMAHQGLHEVSSSSDNAVEINSKYWAGRPSDRELEVEMLKMYMEYRGLGDKEAQKVIAQARPVNLTTLQKTAQGYELQYKDTFARVWRLVGIALDRIGMTVEDRNRSAGIYYIQIPDTFVLDDKGGFFASSKKPSHNKYLLSVTDKGDSTVMTVKPRGEVGKDIAAVSKKILEEIKNNLQ